MTADALTTAPIDIEAIVPWLQMCGACDAGLPTSCTCPTGDPRPVMLALHNEVERLQERIDKAREYVADPGNWSGMDGRQRHILALLDGAALSPDTTEELDPEPSADKCIPCACACQHGTHDDGCQTPCPALRQAEREGTWPRPSTDTEGGAHRG